MSESVARAVGASGGCITTIAGKECVAKPLGVRQLAEVERDCLDRYKRQYLESFAANLDLLPSESRASLLEKKLDEISRWDIDALPPKYAYDPVRVNITPELKTWLIEYWSIEEDISDIRLMRLTAAAMDQGSLSEEEYQKLSRSKRIPKVRVPYVNWWITGNYNGMVTMIWVCFRHEGVSREAVIDAVGGNAVLLNELARDIERLSAPQVGNG